MFKAFISFNNGLACVYLSLKYIMREAYFWRRNITFNLVLCVLPHVMLP